MDEACDLHVVHVVKSSKEGPQTNMSGPEFRQALSKGWLRTLPAPQVLRYDEEGFLKRLDVVEWLEAIGIRLEPIAGESPWQLGKHSKHIQTLKESMNLLCTELQNVSSPEEVLNLSLSAKNNMHNIRGYSPNQWAFGQNDSPISSFLSQGDHPPTESARGYEDFESALQRETSARKHFLEIDARRRVQRALRAQGRPLREFSSGDLVYYYRRGRKEGSRYGGHWYGPARVLCHEKTGDGEVNGGPGSTGKMLRCSPEQLRAVTEDLRRLDADLNGPRSFHDMLAQVANQQRYLDITLQHEPSEDDMQPLEEVLPPLKRMRGKQRDPNEQPVLGRDDIPSLLLPPDGESQPEGPLQSALPEGSRANRGSNPGRARADPEHPGGRDRQLQDSSQEVQGQNLQRPVPGQGVREMVDRAPNRHSEDHLGRNAADPHPSRAPPRERHSEPGRSSPSENSTPGDSRDRKRGPAGAGTPEDCDGQRAKPRRDGPGRGDEPSRGSGDRSGGAAGVHDPNERVHREDGAHAGRHPDGVAAHRHEAGIRDGTPVRSRSRFPRARGDPDHVLFNQAPLVPEDVFTGYVGELNVVEMAFNVSPRDVHCSKGVWVVNQKAKKNVEVQLRKLSQAERGEFEQAMKAETQSFMSTAAVRICEAAGIPPERIMGMRFVYTWKTICDNDGVATGRKAKARLIVPGFEDPNLLEIPRESLTLSTMGRNLLLTECARKSFRVSVGDIKTAFLRGDDTEWSRQVYADPPPEVKAQLGMTDTQVFRIVKAIYGLLNAPKMWHESLSQFLLKQGWVRHATDQCLYKLLDPESQEVVGYLGVHVDDIITGGRGDFYDVMVKQLRERYPFGAWQCAQNSTVVYCG